MSLTGMGAPSLQHQRCIYGGKFGKKKPVHMICWVVGKIITQKNKFPNLRKNDLRHFCLRSDPVAISTGLAG